MPKGVYARESLRSRFLRRFTKAGPPHPCGGRCWVWLGRVRYDGYGVIDVDREETGAHRVSYALFVGPVPASLAVLHRCDNRRCVNPGHLFLGTNTDNSFDMVAKDRQAKGEGVGTSKLTEQQVREARRLYHFRQRGSGTHALARRFGVSQSTIWAAINGMQWRHVE
jgi:hypothetical protein